MIKRNMTRGQVLEMIKANGWEIYREEKFEMYGDECIDLTIVQGDHAVAVEIDENDVVYDIQFVPLYELD